MLRVKRDAECDRPFGEILLRNAPGETARVRGFTYDSLSRLIGSSNPETGTITYSYDANGNVLTKTSPAVNATSGSQTIGYSYDGLNRLCYKVYGGAAPSQYPQSQGCPSSAPTNVFAQYWYDASPVSGASNTNGRLTDEKSYAGNSLVSERKPYSYDAMGHLLNETQCTFGNCSTTTFQPAYIYDLAGNLSTFTDGVTQTPASQATLLTFTNAFDSGGRLQTVTSNWSDSTHPATLFSAGSQSSTLCSGSSSSPYAAFGGLMNATYGIGSSSSGFTLNRTYDQRLRTNCELDLGSSSTAATNGSATVTITGIEQSQQ